MTRIDPAALNALVRSQLTSRIETAKLQPSQAVLSGQKPLKASSHAPSQASDAALHAGGFALEKKWNLRLKAIQPDDPNRARKAFRLFMEAVLARKFKDLIPSDIQFTQILEQVLQQIEDDPELRGTSLKAGEALLHRALRLQN